MGDLYLVLHSLIRKFMASFTVSAVAIKNLFLIRVL